VSTSKLQIVRINAHRANEIHTQSKYCRKSNGPTVVWLRSKSGWWTSNNIIARLLISGCSTDDKTWRRLGSRCAVPAGVEDLQVDRWLPCCRSRTVNRFRARIPDVMAEHLEGCAIESGNASIPWCAVVELQSPTPGSVGDWAMGRKTLRVEMTDCRPNNEPKASGCKSKAFRCCRL
jgi:hypothetical protein